jgi:hypothetical protein
VEDDLAEIGMVAGDRRHGSSVPAVQRPVGADDLAVVGAAVP